MENYWNEQNTFHDPWLDSALSELKLKALLVIQKSCPFRVKVGGAPIESISFNWPGDEINWEQKF